MVPCLRPNRRTPCIGNLKTIRKRENVGKLRNLIENSRTEFSCRMFGCLKECSMVKIHLVIAFIIEHGLVPAENLENLWRTRWRIILWRTVLFHGAMAMTRDFIHFCWWLASPLKTSTFPINLPVTFTSVLLSNSRYIAAQTTTIIQRQGQIVCTYELPLSRSCVLNFRRCAT